MINSWEVVRFIHKLGSPLNASVIGYDQYGRVLMETGKGYQAILPAHWMEDSPSNSTCLPEIGEEFATVVMNCVDGVLCLSARPSDTSQQSIEAWRAYYDFIDTLKLDSRVRGTVTRIQAFGLFVDIGAPYIGLVDVGHSRWSGGDPLPDGMSLWPQVGDEVDCHVKYFRLRNQQIGLGWINAKINTECEM